MLVGMQFMQDIGQMFAVHTQQYMRKDTYVKVIGRHQQKLTELFGKGQRIQADPYKLAINYDIITRDGSIPGGNFSDVWIELYKIIATDPALRQQYDTFRIFEFIAMELGAKNIGDFRNTEFKQMPDEQVIAEVDKGNLIPTGE